MLSHLSPFILLAPPPPTSTLFPYTTLFRSAHFGIEPAQEQQRVPVAEKAAHRARLPRPGGGRRARWAALDRKSTRLNSSHANISYAVFCLKKKKDMRIDASRRTINTTGATS